MKQEFSLIRTKSFYDYTMVNNDDDTWFVNFADPTLFICYEKVLFAQDEIQNARNAPSCILLAVFG